jgi:putative heme iron utilization protein
MDEDEKKKDVLLATTEDAVRLAKTLIRTARHGALAVIDPKSGAPLASRVGVSTDIDGTPVILISKLAPHTGALLADPRCSLMVGDPGKGDPLAHARVSLYCRAAELERGSEDAGRVELRYLAHQPKAKLYAGLGDFRFFRLEPQAASLNAGFGRAYALTAADVLTANPANAEIAETEPSAVEHMNDDHAQAVGLYARHYAKAPEGNWKLAGVDAEGMDLADGDDIRRVFFDKPLTSAKDVHITLVKMAGEARQALGVPGAAS